MVIKKSITEIVELVCRYGDIDATYISSRGVQRMQEGIKIHNKIQRKRKKEYKELGSYEKEQKIAHEYECIVNNEKCSIIMNGRIDGVILLHDDTVILEEIKSTTRDVSNITLESNFGYMSQLFLYGYMYCKLYGYTEIKLHLTYVEVESLTEKILEVEKNVGELGKFFDEIMDKYIEFVELEQMIIKKRNETGEVVCFPYGEYRANQRELMVAVYQTIQNNKNIFVQAPTGTGKTISTLFPAIKSLCKGTINKVFYVTAKNITRQVAVSSLIDMQNNGLVMRSIVLEAKEKSCMCDEVNCTPEYCVFAKGHFDRVNPAIKDIVANETVMTKDIVRKYSEKYKLCQFEFQLDISNFCDVIIGDYNYVYNPKSMLKRFFVEGGDYTILIDEAHNLNERACDMYTSSVNTDMFVRLNEIVGRKDKVWGRGNKVINYLDTVGGDVQPYEYKIHDTEPVDIVYMLQDVMKYLDVWLDSHRDNAHYNEALQTNFDIMDFLRIYEYYDENYRVVIKRYKDNVNLKLLCLCAKDNIRAVNSLCKGIVYFSATLSPLSYYRDIYGGSKEDYKMVLQSPFDKENCDVIIDTSISTYYKDREKSYGLICDRLMEISKKDGNYFVFFSSYEYLDNVVMKFGQMCGDNVNIHIQNRNMQENEREEFLLKFSEKPVGANFGFVVLGGVFGEGVDLKGDRLTGVVVVGVGLPMINDELNIRKNYFDQIFDGRGYEFVYTYPGFNKVMQGAGRLIRTETDMGFIMLIDSRYKEKRYVELLPEHLRR